MAKRFKAIEDFSGGINNYEQLDSIADNEVTSTSNMVCEGKIVRSINPEEECIAPLVDYTLEGTMCHGFRGYGGFAFTSDWDDAYGDSEDRNNVATTFFLAPYLGAQTELTSGTLEVGKRYKITDFHAGDDFTNVGAASNATDVEFWATGTTPTTWANGSGVTGYGGAGYNWFAEVDTDWNVVNITPMILNGGDDHKPIYTTYSGKVRVCNADFVVGTSDPPVWYGYVKKSWFSGNQTWDVWHFGDSNLLPPTRGFCSSDRSGNRMSPVFMQDDSNGTVTTFVDVDNVAGSYDTEFDKGDYVLGVDGEATVIESCAAGTHTLTIDEVADATASKFAIVYPAAGAGFNVTVDSSGVASSGTWNAESIEFASSFTYDDDQESLLYELYGESQTLTADQSVNFEVFFNAGEMDHTDTTNPGFTYGNMKGGRIYYRKAGSNDKWKLLVDIDFSRGTRGNLTDEWSLINGYSLIGIGDMSDNCYYRCEITHIDPPTLTYDAINGYSPDELGLYAEYKCATLYNNRLFVGNVQIQEIADDVTLNDRVMYSAFGKCDTLPTSFYFINETRDGDEVKALAAYNDRLFVFKVNKMYIVNISASTPSEWYVESEHKGMGTSGPWGVTNIDFGLAWISEFGCYLYDGQKVRNLYMDKQNNKRFTPSGDWDEICIGYEPEYKWIVLSGVHSTGTNKHTAIYNMLNDSWSLSNQFNFDTMSNFFNVNNRLYAYEYGAS